jgi:hypothetical protein
MRCHLVPHGKVSSIHDGQPVVGVSGDLSQPATTNSRNEQSTNSYVLRLCHSTAQADLVLLSSCETRRWSVGRMFEIGDVAERTHGANCRAVVCLPRA